MKRMITNTLFAFLALSTANMVFAYTWEFANHSELDIEIKLNLAAGPTETVKVKAGEQQTIGWEAPNFYAGFCLGSLQYRAQTDNKNAAWSAVNVKWIPENGLELMLTAIGEIGSGAQSAAVASAKIAGAIESGGASEMISNGEILKGKAKRENAAAAGRRQARGETIGNVADAAGSADLGGFIKGIGSSVTLSGCRGRHYDIFADDKGIYFTTLQQ